jgi:hypothetical protein
MAAGAREQLLDREQIQDLGPLRPAERAAKISRGQIGGEVEQRSRDRRDRDPITTISVGLEQSAWPVDRDPGLRAMAATIGGNVDSTRSGVSHSPQRRGAVMAQNSIGTAREDRREAIPMTREQWMAHRIDAEMNRVQAARIEPVLDRVAADPARDQLVVRHDPVLTRRQVSDHSIGVPIRGRIHVPASTWAS